MTSVTGSDTDAAGQAHPVMLTTADGQRLEFGCLPGRSVLEAAAAAGAALPASCHQGTCGSCHATVTDGPYELASHSPQALPADERAGGDVLLCRTFPTGPLSVALPYAESRILYGGIPVRDSVIVAIAAAGRETVRLELRLEPTAESGLECQFDAGQFMELQVPGQEERRAYSPANTGNWEGRLEFFVRLRPGGLFSTYLRERARPGDRVIVHGPQGAFGLHERGLRPRWFVAGGTGLAPLLAMARQMAQWQDPQPARLFFGVNEEADLFGVPELQALTGELPGFSYDVCFWRPGASQSARSATPADLVAASLAGTPAKPDLYVCGPPPLIDSVVRTAAEAGVPADQVVYERFLASSPQP